MTNCRQAPCSKLPTLASLPCQKGSGCLWKEDIAVAYATENPNRTGRKYHAFHPSSRESPVRVRFGRDVHGIVTAEHCRVKAKKKIEGDHNQLLNGNGTLKTGRSQLHRIVRAMVQEAKSSPHQSGVISSGKSSTMRYSWIELRLNIRPPGHPPFALRC